MIIAIVSCGDTSPAKEPVKNALSGGDSLRTDSLPLPYSTKSTKNFSRVIGWPAGKTPIAPHGFTVSRFADNLAAALADPTRAVAANASLFLRLRWAVRADGNACSETHRESLCVV